MSLVPYRSKHSVSDRFTGDDFFAPFFAAENVFPALDVSEDINQYAIEIDVPGVKKEDVKVTFDNGILTIQGERKSETESKDKSYHRMERSYGKFVRSINLGRDVDTGHIKANYKEGVLAISVPKSERAKPKSIDIQVA